MIIKNNIESFVVEFEKKIDNVKENDLLEKIGFYIENEMKKRFDQSQDYKGNKWKKLKYRNGKPLIDTGALVGSLGNAEISGNTVSIFSNLPYARLHDEGGVIEPKQKKVLRFKIDGKWYFSKKITVPQRQFSGISEKNKTEIKDIVSDFFVEQLK